MRTIFLLEAHDDVVLIALLFEFCVTVAVDVATNQTTNLRCGETMACQLLSVEFELKLCLVVATADEDILGTWDCLEHIAQFGCEAAGTLEVVTEDLYIHSVACGTRHTEGNFVVDNLGELVKNPTHVIAHGKDRTVTILEVAHAHTHIEDIVARSVHHGGSLLLGTVGVCDDGDFGNASTHH